jgi:hypothetical protein
MYQKTYHVTPSTKVTIDTLITLSSSETADSRASFILLERGLDNATLLQQPNSCVGLNGLGTYFYGCCG